MAGLEDTGGSGMHRSGRRGAESVGCLVGFESASLQEELREAGLQRTVLCCKLGLSSALPCGEYRGDGVCLSIELRTSSECIWQRDVQGHK
jgi:hypothetical protein